MGVHVLRCGIYTVLGSWAIHGVPTVLIDGLGTGLQSAAQTQPGEHSLVAWRLPTGTVAFVSLRCFPEVPR